MDTDLGLQSSIKCLWMYLGRTIQQKKIGHVVEADIKSFFDKSQPRMDDKIPAAPNW